MKNKRVSEILSPMIFKELVNFAPGELSYPSSFTSWEAWNKQFCLIIDAFYLLSDESCWKDISPELRAEYDLIIKKGLKLFAKHYQDM